MKPPLSRCDQCGSPSEQRIPPLMMQLHLVKPGVTSMDIEGWHVAKHSAGGFCSFACVQTRLSEVAEEWQVDALCP